MRLVHVVLVVCGLNLMGVASQEPVVVEVEGLFGKYGGYYIAAAILLAAYNNARSTDSKLVKFKIKGVTMTASVDNFDLEDIA